MLNRISLSTANLLGVPQTSLIPSWESPDPEPSLLDEDRVRDQLSAAEELHYVGYAEPALIAGGAALTGVLRLRAGPRAGHSASDGAVLSALLATGALSASEHEVLWRLLRAYRRLVRGYAPDCDAALGPREAGAAFAVMVQMLEPSHGVTPAPTDHPRASDSSRHRESVPVPP